MGLRLRYSAWTLPWLLDFKQKVASIPTIKGSGTGQVAGGLFTTGARSGVTVNLARFDRIDDVIADDEGSLMRVFDGTTIIDEWIIKRGSRSLSSEAKLFPLSGSALPSYFDQILVPAFDAPANPVEQGNWQWGAENILSNPDFEENQVTNQAYSIEITATGGTFTLSDGVDTTDPIPVTGVRSTDSAAIHNALQDDLTAVVDVAVSASGSSPNTYDLLFVDPPFGIALTLNPTSLTGGTATLTPVETGGLTPGAWHRAQQILFGINQEAGGYDAFEVSDDHNHSPGGTYSLKVDPGPFNSTSNRGAGAQQVISVVPGGIYQLSIQNQPESGTDLYRLALFTESGEWIANTSYAGTALTAATFNEMAIADVVIPDGVTRAIFRVQCTNIFPENPSAFFLDSAKMYPGLPATDPGDILTTLFDAHPEIPNWIDYSSISGTDSNGDAYPENISFEVQWGEHYGHVLDRLVDLGYEWELVAKATPVGNLTHDFHLYIPGGRDATYQNGGTPTTAINKGQSIIDGEVVKRIPDYTSVLLEGAGGAWSKVTDATTEAQFGVLEKFVANRQLLNEATRVLAANQVLAYEEANRRAVRVGVTASLFHPRPGVKYRPGDSIPFQIPPALPKESRRVQRVDYTNTFPTQYVVTGSRVLDGEAAAYDLIWRLWRRFTRPPTQESAALAVSGEKGGAFTIQVSAADATGWSKGRADMKCVGTNDFEIINAAAAELPPGGTLWLSEGHFTGLPGVLNIPADIHIRGMGPADATVIQVSGGTGPVLALADDCIVSDLTIHNTGCSVSTTALAGPGSERVSIRNVRLSNHAIGVAHGGDGWNLENVTGHILPIFIESTVAGHSDLRITNCRTAGLIDISGTTDVVIGGGSILGSVIELGAGSNIKIDSDVVFLNPGGSGTSLIHADGGSGISIGDVQAYDGSGYFAISLENCTEVRIDGGQYGNITRGVYLDTCQTVKIIGPDLGLDGYLGQHGISVIDCDDVQIVAPLIIDPGQDTHNTYDGLFVSGGSRVSARKVKVRSSSAVSPQPRYGINFVSGSGHSYIDNEAYPSANYATGPYANAAGATNTLPAAGGAQGDNLV